MHGHWLLVRLVRLFPDAAFVPAARAAIGQSLTPEHIAGEVAYLRHEDRASFERPYGLAWLLALAAELRRWDDREAQGWASTLRPLETEAATRVENWAGKLHYPIRVGEHDQTAFSFGTGLGLGRGRERRADAQRAGLCRAAVLLTRTEIVP